MREREMLQAMLAKVGWDPISQGDRYTTTPPSRDDDMMAICDAGFIVGARDWTGASSGQPTWRWTLTEKGRAVLA